MINIRLSSKTEKKGDKTSKNVSVLIIHPVPHIGQVVVKVVRSPNRSLPGHTLQQLFLSHYTADLYTLFPFSI